MIAAMVKPVLGVLAANPVNGLQQGFFQGLIATGGASKHLGFELATGLPARWGKSRGSRAAETAPPRPARLASHSRRPWR